VSGIDGVLVDRLYRRAHGGRWRTPIDGFARALEASAARAFPDDAVDPQALDRHLSSLHLEDLALACACAAGDDEAWEHFIREYRPLLYRAADALDPSGDARDLADGLYGDLFGLRHDASAGPSLFRYFHGRSSLITWLRAVLAQRHVDRLRTGRKVEQLPEEDSARALAAPASSVEADRDHYIELLRVALNRAMAALPPADRLRLACYYGQQMTLAQTGRLFGEHEATASRGLTRVRREIRRTVETDLREVAGLSDAQIARCFECATEDAGTLNLGEMLDMTLEPPARKKSARDRSQKG